MKLFVEISVNILTIYVGKSENLRTLTVAKIFLQVVSLVILAAILLSQKFNLMPYAFGLLIILFTLSGYEQIKFKKNLANGLTILSAAVIIIFLVGFSFL